MLSLPVTFDYWRNYKPYAPDLEWVITDQNTRTLDLNDLIIQGARDEQDRSPTTGILNKVPAQRGWRCTPVIVGQPSNGIVRVNSTFDGFEYEPKPGYIGFDCFNYVITNGTQQSDIGKVTVDVREWYKHKVIAIRKSENMNTHEFILEKDFPEGLPPIHMQTFEWTYSTLEQRLVNGVMRVLPKVTEYKTSIGKFYVGEECRVTVNFTPFLHGTKNRLVLSTPKDDFKAFDGYSNLLYQEKNLRGNLRVKVKLYYASIERTFSFRCWRTISVIPKYRHITKTVVDLNTYHELEYDFGEIFGKRWHESGNILIPGISYKETK